MLITFKSKKLHASFVNVGSVFIKNSEMTPPE